MTAQTQPTIAIDDILFGVTGHHAVIGMKVTLITDVDDDYSMVEVAPIDTSDEYAKTQVRLVFNDLLFFDGEINKERVFTDEAEAKAYALTKLAHEEEGLTYKLHNLKVQKAKLQS